MTNNHSDTGKLFIVATPIGNRGDITNRALEILSECDLVAAEDTRKTNSLLTSYGLKKKIHSIHDNNEEQSSKKLMKKLLNGFSIALVCDAGTPCISDPGYRLIKLAHEEGIKTYPVPGPTSIVAALSVSGLASDRFCFEGFLHSKSEKRKSRLKKLAHDTRTIIFLISVHKVEENIKDIISIFGGQRQCFLAREMTKLHEQYIRTDLDNLFTSLRKAEIKKKGEFVLVIEGASEKNETADILLAKKIYEELSGVLSNNKLINLIMKTTELKRNDIYNLLLNLKRKK
jgi:16S rRNA (cytidine1402-2'-O)-methyltransferase